MSDSHVAVIGAGPYGLAAAAHLRAAGVETIVFGEPMAFWERNMPTGMLLRSTRRSSSIADPHGALTLARYEEVTGRSLPDPLTLDSFVAYGHWFQHQVVADVDPRRVLRLDSEASGFRLLLDDGSSIRVRRAVVAAGIGPFAWCPAQFEGLTPSLASHSSEVREFGAFANRRVLVVGAGQSALECAALLNEAGADVEIVARAPRLRWIPQRPSQQGWYRRQIRRLMYPPTEVGPRGLNWIAAVPDIFRRMPGVVRPEIAARCTLPVGASWLPSRLGGVVITTGRSIASAEVTGEFLRVTLDDGTRREVDRALVATGYVVDVRRYAFIGPELLDALSVVDGYPRLSTGLEASIPGLHFLGAPAALTFGPVMRFVTGSWYSAPALTRKVLGRPPLPLCVSW